MKEITRVHLAKTPYSIELDAKKELEKYLKDIEENMHAEAEALEEIEARMSELLAERGVAADQVVTLSDVASLRAQLGEPKEFSDGDGVAEVAEARDYKSAKRFMRDGDNAVLGGVCSGLATYFNADVVLVRFLAVALLLISFGTFFLIYIVLWIITPKAQSAADRLTMAGRPVTLEALAATTDSDTAQTRGVRPAARVLRYLLGIIILLVAAGTMVGVLVGGFIGYDGVSWMTDFAAQPWAFAMLASLFVGGIALVVLFGLLAYVAFSWTMRRAVAVAMFVMLAVGVFATAGVAISATQVRSIIPRDEARLTKIEKLAVPADLSGIKSIEVLGASVTYGYQSSGPARAELRYWAVHDIAKPEVKVEKRGDVLWIEVKTEDIRACPVLIQGSLSCSVMSPEVVIYGFDNIDSAESSSSGETVVVDYGLQ